MTTLQNPSACLNYLRASEPLCGALRWHRDRAPSGSHSTGLPWTSTATTFQPPCSAPTLLAPTGATLRRAPMVPRQGPQRITFDGITVDLDSHHVSTQGTDIRLTPKQFEVLNYLIANANVSIPHAKILQAVWGPDYGDEVEYLHVVVNQIRKKIEPNPTRPRYIVTEPWLGYRFQLPSGK